MEKYKPIFDEKKAELNEGAVDAMIFNSTLASIGGNTSNFLNADTLRKYNNEIMSVPEIKKVADEISKLYAEWSKIRSSYEKKGRELHDKASKIITQNISEIKYI